MFPIEALSLLSKYALYRPTFKIPSIHISLWIMSLFDAMFGHFDICLIISDKNICYVPYFRANFDVLW